MDNYSKSVIHLHKILEGRSVYIKSAEELMKFRDSFEFNKDYFSNYDGMCKVGNSIPYPFPMIVWFVDHNDEFRMTHQNMSGDNGYAYRGLLESSVTLEYLKENHIEIFV